MEQRRFESRNLVWQWVSHAGRRKTSRQWGISRLGDVNSLNGPLFTLQRNVPTGCIQLSTLHLLQHLATLSTSELVHRYVWTPEQRPREPSATRGHCPRSKSTYRRRTMWSAVTAAPAQCCFQSSLACEPSVWTPTVQLCNPPTVMMHREPPLAVQRRPNPILGPSRGLICAF